MSPFEPSMPVLKGKQFGNGVRSLGKTSYINLHSGASIKALGRVVLLVEVVELHHANHQSRPLGCDTSIACFIAHPCDAKVNANFKALP